MFVRTVSSPVRAACEHCGSKKMRRVVSKFAIGRAAIDFGSDAGMGALDESDPRAMARMARQMQEESGEAMEPEMEEALSRIEAGEDPEAVMGEAGMDDGEEF